MFTICRFYGISIRMFYADHRPPHLHALYDGQQAQIAIEPLALLRGSLPPRALALVMEWAILRRAELIANWRKARGGEPLDGIEPIR